MEVQRVFRGLGGPGGLQNAKHHIQQSNTISLKSSYAPILKSFANIYFAEIRYLGYHLI